MTWDSLAIVVTACAAFIALGALAVTLKMWAEAKRNNDPYQ